MTFDDAKAILNLCPPDDTTNPDVPGLSGALVLATANKQLGAWWELQKEFDGQFARKLASLEPPPELATTIMRGGATIFFASRLIAESAGETPQELPLIHADSTNLISTNDKLQAALKALKPQSDNVGTPSWLKHAATFSVAVVLLLIVLAMLFLLFWK